jgi:hypothetical protein
MRKFFVVVKQLLLLSWGVWCVILGSRDGYDYGLVYFLLGLVFAMMFKRMLFGPRNLSYGYKNGYTPDRVEWHGVGEYTPGHSFDKKTGLF